MKLYVKLNKEGYIIEYKFSSIDLYGGWILTDEKEVNEKTPFSKLVDGKFVLDEQKWDEYIELLQ